MPLDEAWDAVLFNSFHDILPGTSIERALDEQLDWLGGALTSAAASKPKPCATCRACSAVRAACRGGLPYRRTFSHRQSRVGTVYRVSRTRSLPRLPAPLRLSRSAAELPLEVRDAQGVPQPFQVVATEHDFMEGLPWRARVLVPVGMAARETRVFTLGYVEGQRLRRLTRYTLAFAARRGHRQPMV
jgi:alpha-mannosidase